MPQRNVTLATLTGTDKVTYYMSTWTNAVLRESRAKGTKTVILHTDRATLEANIAAYQPSFIIGVAHGYPEELGIYRNLPLVDLQNAHITRDTVSYFISCNTAETLGPATIANGAKAFIGFDQDFIFWINEHALYPIGDTLARPFMLPIMKVIRSLAAGRTTGEAYKDSKNIFREQIRLWNSKNTLKAKLITNALRHDLDSFVLLGDRSVTVSDYQN